MGREMLLFRGGNHTLLGCDEDVFQQKETQVAESVGIESNIEQADHFVRKSQNLARSCFISTSPFPELRVERQS